MKPATFPCTAGPAIPFLLVLLLTSASTASAGDWPQWRGPYRDGNAAESTLPAELPQELNRLWSVEVGTGHSSPVVVGDRVYIFSREGEDEVARALDLDDGSEIWSSAMETPYRRNPAAFLHGKGPKSTPVANAGSLCTLGISGRLTCLDRESGAVLWQRDFSDRFDRAWPDFGTATSPAVFDDHLIAHVGGIREGSLSAFALGTGEEIWSWAEEGPGYASPIAVDLEGVKQIVTHSRENVISVAADSGELLWKMQLKTPYDQSSVTPIQHGSRLIISGLDSAVIAIEPRPDGRGNWLVQRVWRNAELPMYMSSPVILGNLLFGLTDKRKGQLFCMNADTGEVQWTSTGREGDNASLILSGERLIVLNTEAELSIAPATAEGWQPEASYTVADSATWAHPALVGNRILIKDKTHLTAWSFE